MWLDQTLIQRDKATERVVGVELGGNKEEGCDNIWERRGRQYSGCLHEIGGKDPSANYDTLPNNLESKQSGN